MGELYIAIAFLQLGMLLLNFTITMYWVYCIHSADIKYPTCNVYRKEIHRVT